MSRATNCVDPCWITLIRWNQKAVRRLAQPGLVGMQSLLR
jgi:hypothetical protein